ncbi:10182_t:CDS:2 [Paraglomus occultum]|uniref:10182_t:CDS:1 n=1 Tax=Paraglomus occultum TaxID=144539 RepID=A0A9N8ZKI0_9GLOM|nr:10182_t:CDS:2 [Paraglomus occultum]
MDLTLVADTVMFTDSIPFPPPFSRQIIANYNNKSADGLSLPFLFNWLLGDIANFIGCVLTDQQPFQYLYYRRFYSTQEEEILCDDVLMAEGSPKWRHYNTFPVNKPASRQRGTMPLFAVFFFTLRSLSYLTSSGLTTSHSIISHSKRDTMGVSWLDTIGTFMEDYQYSIGRVMAWTCTVLYLTSRMPQIWKNFERKSVEGLSIFMFIFAALGNLAYTTSIFLYEDKDDDYYNKEFPYILGASGTLTFDLIIYMQWWKYRNNPPKRRFSSIPYDLENSPYLPATIRDARSRLLAEQY